MRSIAALLLVVLLMPSVSLAEVRAIAFPVQGTFSFRNDFGEPRDGGARSHEGIDIIAAKMTPIVAVADGTITFIAIPQASWGYSITIRDNDGYQYRYLHMNNDTPGTDDGAGGEVNAYAPGLHRGSTVTKGQLIGWVGDSGNAEATVSHLHFEMYAPGRVLMSPYDSLVTASGGVGVNNNATTPVTYGDEGSLQEEAAFVATRQLQEGMIDAEVKFLHQDLHTLGFYSGPIDETYSAETREAVRRFQAAQKITPTGIADAETRKKIAQLITPTGSTFVFTKYLERGSNNNEVRQLQTVLKTKGYFTVEPTGYFGPITEASVRAFQNAKGIEPLGVVGPKTRAALNAL